MAKVSVYSFAKHIGRSRWLVREMVNRGEILKNPDGTVDFDSAMKAYRKRYPDGRPVVSRDGVKEELERVKLERLEYEVGILKMAYKKRKSELVLRSDVVAEVENVRKIIIDGFAAMVKPTAALCAGKTAREIEMVIDDAINRTIAEIRAKVLDGLEAGLRKM